MLFAVAVFLIFCLGATDKAGVMGRGIETGLVYVFGKLAFLVPVGLIAVGVTTVFSYRLRRSLRFLGVVVFLVGLFLLMGGGVPPFGHHGAELFTRAEFEGKAGALGEALYGGVHGLLGIVGVGIVGWVLELAGFSLVTGVTARWLGGQTRSAAQAVKNTAERTAILNRQRDGEFDFEPAEWPAHAPREPRPAGGDPRAGGGFRRPLRDRQFGADRPGRSRGRRAHRGHRHARDERAGRLRRRVRRLGQRAPGHARAR